MKVCLSTILFVMMSVLFAACAPVPAPVEEIESTTIVEPTAQILPVLTLRPATATPSPGPLPTITLTPTLDPGLEDPDYYYGGLVMTMNDVGQTIEMKPKGSFMLSLGEQYSWTVTVDPPEVFSKNPNVVPMPGEQGVFIARQKGKATLSAVGDPICRLTEPPCMRPSLLFTLYIVVK